MKLSNNFFSPMSILINECKKMYRRLFKTKRTWREGRFVGGYMPHKKPGSIEEITGGPNIHGVREVILGEPGGLRKSAAPETWSQLDYANRLQEAYDVLERVTCLREGVWKLNGIDKSGVIWEMYLECNEGVYRLTTGYPKL